MTDEIEQGREPARSPRPPSSRRRALVTAVTVVVAAAVVAVAAWANRSDDTSPRPTPSGTTARPDAGPPLQLTSARCARLDGTRLTLGFGVVNRATTTITVEQLDPSFPLGGLTPDAEAVPAPGACPTGFAPVPVTLRPGAEVVLQFVLTATDPQCIAPLPVDVEVTYDLEDRVSSPQDLHAFPDLGDHGLPSECGSPAG